MSQTLKDIIRQVISRPSLQWTWMTLLRLSHAGMNCGGGQTVANSGELSALELVIKSCPSAPPYVIFDVGANKGEYLGELLARSTDPVIVYSFEPEHESFRILRMRFGGFEQTRLLNVALGKDVGTSNLILHEDSSQSSIHVGNDPDPTRFQLCEMTTLDKFITDNHISRVDYLKIDTEGHEVEVLLGARHSIEQGLISAIQLEFGETYLATQYHFQTLFQLLSSRYQIYRILRQGLYRIDTYTHDLEVYKTTNYLCTLK